MLPAGAFPAHWASDGPETGVTSASFFDGMGVAVVDPSTDGALTTCLGVPAGEGQSGMTEVAGPTYGDQTGLLQAGDTVEVYPTAGAAAEDAEAAADPRAPHCVATVEGSDLATALPEGFSPGVSVGTITVAARPLSPVGDHAADLELTVPLTTRYVRSTMDIDVVTVQVGRSESVVQVDDMVGPPPMDLVAALAGAAAARLSG